MLCHSVMRGREMTAHHHWDIIVSQGHPHISVPFTHNGFCYIIFLLLRFIEHNDQKIAPYCESVIKAPEVVLLAKIHHVQQVLLTALAPVPVKFLLISSHHCFLSLCLSQQWKSLFDKVCSASHSGFSHSPSACFTHCGGALSSGVLICV